MDSSNKQAKRNKSANCISKTSALSKIMVGLEMTFKIGNSIAKFNGLSNGRWKFFTKRFHQVDQYHHHFELKVEVYLMDNPLLVDIESARGFSINGITFSLVSSLVLKYLMIIDFHLLIVQLIVSLDNYFHVLVHVQIKQRHEIFQQRWTFFKR